MVKHKELYSITLLHQSKRNGGGLEMMGVYYRDLKMFTGVTLTTKKNRNELLHFIMSLYVVAIDIIIIVMDHNGRIVEET